MTEKHVAKSYISIHEAATVNDIKLNGRSSSV